MDHSEAELPAVFTRSAAVAAGLSRHQIEHRLARDWQVLRRGVYCRRSTWREASPAGRHLLVAVAVLLTHPNDQTLTLSHLSAALVWDLPVPAAPSWPVCLTARPGHRQPRVSAASRGSRGSPARDRPGSRPPTPVRIQVATLRPGDRVRVRGSWVTTPARTAADCLRHCEPQVSVPIADAVLWRGLASTAELDAALRRQETWPFAARARRSRRIVTARRSAAVSRSAVALAAAGIDRPAERVAVHDRLGHLVAGVDFAWAAQGVVGQVVGAGGAGDAELLGELGLRVLRWTEDDLRRPDLLAARIARARRSWDGSWFTGSVHPGRPVEPPPPPGHDGAAHPELPRVPDG